MASLAMKLKAERRMRELLDEEGLAPPDVVEYGDECVRLFWYRPKVVVVVDVDDEGEIGESRLDSGATDNLRASEPSVQSAHVQVIPLQPTPDGNRGSHEDSAGRGGEAA